MKKLLPFLALTISTISATAQTQFNQQDPKTTLQNTFDNAKSPIHPYDLKGKTCIILNGSLDEIEISEKTLKANSNRGPLFPEQTKTFPWTSYISIANNDFDKIQVAQSTNEIKVTHSNQYILVLRKSGDLVAFTLTWKNEPRYGYCWQN